MRKTVRKLAPLMTPLVLALAILIAFARCTPAWLPDSGGFVYVTNSGAVVYHSLKTGKTKKLVAGGTPGAGVAVWSTGDRVTVVRGEGEGTVRIRTYDLDGNEKDASPAIELAGSDKEGQWLSSVAVSSDGKYVVAFAPGQQTALIYDVKQKTHRTVEKLLPLGYVAGLIAGGAEGKSSLTFDASPLTPDGKGLIALSTAQDGGEAKFVYALLAGGEPVELKLSDEDNTAIKKMGEEKTRRVALVPQWAGGNMGSVCEMQVDDVVLRLNVAKKSTTLVKDMASDAVFQHAEKQKVTVLCRLAEGALLQVNEEKQLQLWRRSGETTLIAKIEGDGGFVALSPSPDRRKLLVRIARGESDRLLAIDAGGRTLADLKQSPREQ